MENAVIAQSVERVIGNDEVGSSNLPNSSIFAVIAQSVERVIGNDEVGSSNLPNSSKRSTVDAVLRFLHAEQKMEFELPTSRRRRIQSATDVGCEAANIRQFKSA